MSKTPYRGHVPADSHELDSQPRQSVNPIDVEPVAQSLGPVFTLVILAMSVAILVYACFANP